MSLRHTSLPALLMALALALPASVPAAPDAPQNQQPASGEWADVEKRLQANHEAMLKAVKASPTPLEGWWRSQRPDASGLPLVQFQGQASATSSTRTLPWAAPSRSTAASSTCAASSSTREARTATRAPGTRP